MGEAHLQLRWGKLLWSQLWIDHMFFFARQWQILSKVVCFAMVGSQRQLKGMLCNSGDLSLLRSMVVLDNHTIDDSLRREGWDPTKRSMRGQGPLSVQLLAARACRLALSDLAYVKTCGAAILGPQEAALTQKPYTEMVPLVSHTLWSCVLSCGNSPNLVRI